MGPIAQMVATLRAAFPDGLQEEDYWAVLFVLYEDMSDENLSKAVSEFTGRHRLDVWNDIPKAISRNRPETSRAEEVRNRLRGAGWEPDDDDWA